MNLSSFIWSVADLLRGRYRPHEYGQVILPFTVLRRMDCVLEPTKQAVLKEATKREPSGTSVNPFLTRASGATFYNTSPMDLKAIVGDQDNIAINLAAYLHGSSSNVKDIFTRFKLEAQIDRLAKSDLLYLGKAGKSRGKAGQTEVTLKQTSLSALPLIACYGSNTSVHWLSSVVVFLGRPRFCGARLRCTLRSSEPMNSGAPRGRPV